MGKRVYRYSLIVTEDDHMDLKQLESVVVWKL